MDLHRSMRLFIEVAQEGSLTAAGKRMGISSPSASRLLRDLEDWIGQPLVRRSTRHLALTELGERYLPRCIEIVESTKALKSNLSKHAERPTGNLRVTVASIVARRVVAAVIPRFLAENPSVTISLNTTDQAIDLMVEKMDIAIRVGNLEDSSLVSRKIFEFRVMLVASPGFLSRHVQPTKVSELSDLPCLIDTVPKYGARWPFLRGRKVKGPVEISDGEIIRDLALSGMGVAYLPELLVETELSNGLLIEILPGVSSETLGVYSVFPPREYISAAARVFAKAVEVAFAKKGHLL
jgi:DNA-binding transcriptional LysR family regulator